MPELTLDMKRLSTQMLRCALAIRVQPREYFTERQIGQANRIPECKRKPAAFSERGPGRCVRSASVVEGGFCFTWELRWHVSLRRLLFPTRNILKPKSV